MRKKRSMNGAVIGMILVAALLLAVAICNILWEPEYQKVEILPVASGSETKTAAQGAAEEIRIPDSMAEEDFDGRFDGTFADGETKREGATDGLPEDEISGDGTRTEEGTEDESSETDASGEASAEGTAAGDVSPSAITAGEKVTEAQIEAEGLSAWFTSSTISDQVFHRMQGLSYPASCTVPRDDLRYLRVLHYTFSGDIKVGELVCHKDVASNMLAVFQELYAVKYPIQRMRLVDDYGGNDLASAAANNTSCFNFRVTAGTGDKLSSHAYGKAVDINPLYNPYVWSDANGERHCAPEEGRAYMDREATYPYRITTGDVCVQIFQKYGFYWGGDYQYEKDYMHFSIQ